jgi:hypothetical protein
MNRRTLMPIRLHKGWWRVATGKNESKSVTNTHGKDIRCTLIFPNRLRISDAAFNRAIWVEYMSIREIKAQILPPSAESEIQTVRNIGR